MPLSDHEQRILDEIERRLAAEDPKFARSTSAATPRGVAIRRVKRASLVFVGGFVLMIAGLVTSLTEQLGIAGFVVMLLALFVIARASRDIGPMSARAHDPSQTWFGRAEERWRKRFERDDG
ncbi:MAG TPA: DUF3040 domain-containing protein [Actinomycetota bacterium]|nr:DUF3040 domain-containing protein [Actinomycetota bacterium]